LIEALFVFSGTWGAGALLKKMQAMEMVYSTAVKKRDKISMHHEVFKVCLAEGGCGFVCAWNNGGGLGEIVCL
jgi:hypothetical protein